MKKLLLLIFILGNMAFVFGQSPTDSITVVNNKFMQYGQPMTTNQLMSIMQDSPKAIKEMSIAKSNSGIANVLGYVGGFMVGWPLGTMLGGGKPNWTVAGIGAGVLLMAIPLASSANKHTKKAVRLYNQSLQNVGQRKTEWHLGINPNGIGLVLRF